MLVKRPDQIWGFHFSGVPKLPTVQSILGSSRSLEIREILQVQVPDLSSRVVSYRAGNSVASTRQLQHPAAVKICI